jgi:hypothetical protein
MKRKKQFPPPASSGRGRWQRSQWLGLLTRNACLMNRLFLLLILFILAVPEALAANGITELKVLGRYYESDMNSVKTTYKQNGWTIVNKDLNEGAGTNSYYVYLAYKTSSSANPETGYITDIVASTSNESSFTYGGRTYYKVGHDAKSGDKGSAFVGDLNHGAGGAYIYLYYTKERTGYSSSDSHGGSKRVITELWANEESSDGVIYWAKGNSGVCDMNKGASGPHIYVMMKFTNQAVSINNDPTFATGLVYNGKALNLVSKAATGNYGTMKYSVDGGSWGTSATATTVGNHTVKYRLDGVNSSGVVFAENSAEKSATVKIEAPSAKPKVEGTFNQRDKKVTLKWSASIPGNYTNYKWVIYRGNTKIITYPRDSLSYEDKGFTNESDVTYYVYYVSNTWNENTKNDDCKGQVTVNTTRKVPVNNLKAVRQDDRIVFTWTSDGYPANWGNKFNIYVDEESSPIYTITPTNGQTSFTWMHRTSQQSGRKNGVDGGVPYTEEPLNACAPHDYRVVGVIDGKVLNEAKLENLAIGSGTQFYSLKATKGVYPGLVKLNWHVDVKSSGLAKTYIVDRRRTDKKDEAWTNLRVMSSTDEYLFYDDDTPLPGVYYDYRVTVQDKCEDGAIVTNQLTDIGFAQTTGTVSGRITYGSTGSAVPGADVELVKTGSSADASEQYHAMHFTDASGYVEWPYPSTSYAADKFNEGDFTIQMWFRPDEFQDTWIAKFAGNQALGMLVTGRMVFGDGSASAPRYGIKLNSWLKKGEYNHVVLTRQADSITCYIVTSDADGNVVLNKNKQALKQNLSLGASTKFQLGFFNGYVDDFRLWTRCLSEDEIKENFDHLLVGNEKNLETYWTFDEGLNSQFFDYSRDGTVYHEHHGTMANNVESATITPEQLALKAKTDRDGNYIIQGIPFSGEGTTYAVMPKLGIHEFNPSQHLRFIGNNSLVHNGTDFNDVSSFPVSGTVLYAGTNYPVEGAMFYVDGNVCSKNGEIIQSAEDGSYTISVPIGKHFIQVKKNGHVFNNAGRYPADPNNTGNEMHLFNSEVKNLGFVDETLVNFTGRVVGGDIQGKKAVGFGLSTNNIGKTELVLSLNDSRYYLNAEKYPDGSGFKNNKNDVPVASATDKIASTSFRQGGETKVDCQKVIIRTDSVTGEFSAMLPPLLYTVESMTVMNSGLTVGDQMTIDLTSPLMAYTDTLYADDGESYELYEYNTKLSQTYHCPPTFTVKQEGREDGSFGIDSYKIQDDLGEIELNDIYSVEGDVVTYNYGVSGYKSPLFIQGDPYTFLIEGYEEYENADNGKLDHVPLNGNIVTISNALSSEQHVYYEQVGDHAPGSTAGLQENQLQLDSLGHAKYRWKAGLPNIAEPYTRTISMTYEVGGAFKQWDGNGMTGIILGSLPTGNNFVTAGPEKVSMVLRDPPGTNSFTEWKTGSSKTISKVEGSTFTENFAASFKHKFGFHKVIGIGAGIIDMEETEACDDLEVGAKTEYENETSTTWVETTSVTQSISTSASPEYVGAQGDVFIGHSSNLLFGKVRDLDLRRQSGNDVEIGLEDIFQTSIQFGTMFMYTQNYIENVMLPNYELMRKKFLTTTTQSNIDTYHNDTDHTVYLTTLSPDDPKFGTEGTYSKFKVPGVQVATDSVAWVNCQIENWKDRLRDNEEEKVKAWEKRKKFGDNYGKNYSFDSGTSYTYETTVQNDTTYSRDWKISGGLILDNSTGFAINDFGFNIHIQDETFGGEHHVNDTTYTHETTFSYTLAEDGDDDAISVDVYNYGDFGPIFHTRGGQTCCPYEGQVATKYYKPGTTIMEATMQIEVPQIDVDVPIVSDVPTGGIANYTLRLSNASEIDEDVYYRLLVDDETNPDGANLMIDGKAITDSRIIKIPAGTTVTKALQLKQTKEDVLNYDSIAIVLASQCQYDPTSTWELISDTVYISAHFVPSSSPVDLALSKTVMNIQTKTDLDLTFSGFDRNYLGLKAFRIQYKKQGATDWTLLREYVLKEDDLTTNNELLPTSGAKVTYRLPMNNFTDGEYVFRVLSVSDYGTDEITRSSQEISLVKDMQRPRPLGQPEPSDGILDIGDDLSITFNEAFLNGDLTKTGNFRVTGVLNGATIAHETALSMQNTNGTAATEASIGLAEKDFSIDTWLYVSGEGTILSHGEGTNKFTVSTNADGNLVVDIAGTTYTSSAVVPTDTWAFLTITYKAGETSGKLSASVAYDGKDISFFNDKDVVAYKGNGPLAVGKNIKGAMHELLLWDEAHDIASALANRSKSKNPSTRHLIGYWKMNEGEGTTIRDYARNRHMTMADETWYLNNENKAIVLDGDKYLSVSAGDLPVFPDDDYAIEFWMRGDAQTGEAQLLQMGEVALWMNVDGQLQFTGKSAYKEADGIVLATSSDNLTDNAWHHVALNVLHQGAAAIYVDGNRVLSTSTANVGPINTDRLMMGARRNTIMEGDIAYKFDRPFKGQIDELRLWDATLNATQLANNRKVRLTGQEDGLILYFPFEDKTFDEYDQVIIAGTDSCLTGNTTKAQLLTFNSQLSDLNYVDEAPALRTKPIETAVSFTFTASDTKIVIDIDEDPATIEGCTLNFVVRDVCDANGNYSIPAIWSAFVNRNELVWADDALSVTQEVKSESSITATIVNKGGKQQMWTLSGMPSWLQASSEYGTTNPLAETSVTFTVSPATPIGKYEETVYLKGNDGIETPLTINVKVTGKVPEWSVNPKDYEFSMNVIGRVDIKNVPMDDEDDIIAAFIGEECRGVAHPVYKERYDGSFITMDIYGNDDNDKEVTFRAFDASTGTLYPVVTPDREISFTPLALIGKYDAPVVFTVVDLIEQSTDLKAGWNWLSLYVKTDTMTVPAVFEKIVDDVITVKSQTDWTMNENGKWKGDLTDMTNDQMYAVQLKADRKLRIVGKPVDPDECPIIVKKNWNWIGYYGRQVAAISDALSGMQPVNGDILKGQSGVTYFDTYEWAGSLPMMEPGVGYMVKSNTDEDRLFGYPAAALAAARAVNESRNVNENGFFQPINFRNYANNAIMTVKLTAAGKTLGNTELGVFADDECRTVKLTNGEGVAYLTIPGDDETTLTFKVAIGDKVFDASKTVSYVVDGVYGSPDSPLVIELSEATGIWEILNGDKDTSVYDLQGRKVDLKDNRRKLSKGVYIINGQKKTVK